MKRFTDLPHGQQVALAAYAALVASEPLIPGEVGLHVKYSRAMGDIASTVGLRGRKRMNQEDRHDRKVR